MFKFYNIPNIDTAKKIIGDSPSIKFSSAFDLNDPFELKFNLKIDPYSEKEKIEFFKNFPQKTINDFSEWQNQVNDQFIWYTEQEQRNELSQMVTLSSFSESNQNNLMWSHYANNHTGICVEYTKNLFEYFETLKNFLSKNSIKYSKNPPIIKNFESNMSKLNKMLFYKQFEWKYEKEFRVVLLSKNKTDIIPIDINFIKSVYIGSKCEDNLSKSIIKMCKYNNIKTYHAVSLGNSYEVEYQIVKDKTIYIKSFWK